MHCQVLSTWPPACHLKIIWEDIWKKKMANFKWVLFTTDLGNLIGNTKCGNFRIFLSLRFYQKLILVILKPKNCHFDHLSISHFWILDIFDIFKCEIPKISKFKAFKIVKTVTFDLLPKLISHKIIVVGKLINCHNVKYPYSKFPIRLPRSVNSDGFVNSYSLKIGTQKQF